MPLNLLDASNAPEGSNAELLTAELIGTDPIMNRLDWVNEASTEYKYSQTVELGDSGTRAINSSRTGTQSKQLQSAEGRRIFSDKMEIDRQIVAGDPSRRAKEEFRKIESTREAWLRMFFKGSSAQDPTQFDGLQARASRPALNGTASTRTRHNSQSGAPLSLGALRRAIRNTQGNAILMPCDVLDYFSEAAETGILKGSVIYKPDEFGRETAYYAGLPIIPIEKDSADVPILGQTELSADGTSNECSSIYIVAFGEGKLQGINFQGVGGRYGIDVRDQGEVGPYLVTFMDWPCSIVAEHHKCLTRLAGITLGPVTN
jgi:hypothetical protein